MMELILAPWEALKITFAVLPGICLITWAGYAGSSPRRVHIVHLWRIWIHIRRAKSEGLREFTRSVVPLCPVLAYIVFSAILLLIPIDTILSLVLNICAAPAALVSYREGRRVGKGHGKILTLEQFDMPWSSILKVFGVWLAATAVVLVCLRASSLWNPAQEWAP